MAADDVIADYDDYWRHSPEDDLWRPQQAHGWTWLQTALGAPECYSLLDGDGELWGHVYERRGRVLCWAPYTWGEEIYYSTERLADGGFGGDANRQWHLERIAHALTAWVEQQHGTGVDLARLRDTQAYRFECENGHVAETLGEHNYRGQTEAAERLGRWPRAADAEDPRLALQLGRGWRAAPEWWCCEGYRLCDATGQMRGHVQVRYGIVRAVAAQPADADKEDPLLGRDNGYDRTCRGEIVLQEPIRRRMAIRFEDAAERDAWLAQAVAAIAGGTS